MEISCRVVVFFLLTPMPLIPMLALQWEARLRPPMMQTVIQSAGYGRLLRIKDVYLKDQDKYWEQTKSAEWPREKRDLTKCIRLIIPPEAGVSASEKGAKWRSILPKYMPKYHSYKNAKGMAGTRISVAMYNLTDWVSPGEDGKNKSKKNGLRCITGIQKAKSHVKGKNLPNIICSVPGNGGWPSGDTGAGWLASHPNTTSPKGLKLAQLLLKG